MYHINALREGLYNNPHQEFEVVQILACNFPFGIACY